MYHRVMPLALTEVANLFINHFRDVNLVPSASNYKIFTDPSTGSKYAEFLLEDQYAYSHKVVLDLDRWNDFTWISKSRSYSISIPKNYDFWSPQNCKIEAKMAPKPTPKRSNIEAKIQDEKKAIQDDLGPVLERSWVVLGRHLGRRNA